MKRRIVSFLLAALMVCAMLPVTAMAEDFPRLGYIVIPNASRNRVVNFRVRPGSSDYIDLLPEYWVVKVTGLVTSGEKKWYAVAAKPANFASPVTRDGYIMADYVQLMTPDEETRYYVDPGDYFYPVQDSVPDFIWPSYFTNVTAYFGYGGYGEGSQSFHDGIDIGADVGSVVYASASGHVTFASYDSEYGFCVKIAHSNGFTSLYGHMSSFAVSVNQNVDQGEVIGYIGNSGLTPHPNLHFSIFDPSGNSIDPLTLTSPYGSASILSEGSLWIVLAVAVLSIGGVAALVIVKKKKKPALADGVNREDNN